MSTLSYDTYDDAAGVHNPETQMVCGVRMEDGSARYFVVDRSTDDETAYEISFEIRHGRPMSQYERWLRETVLDLRSQKEPVGA